MYNKNDLPMISHCPIDPLNETCEKFFQIWSHKAANISNDLIEYTIRRMQSDRLRFLFQTHNEFNHHKNFIPICQMSIHIEDDLQGIKEHIRQFCLTTRNVYRHLRSDSRIYPKMSIELDQSIMIKICRFIFKTKILIKILSKKQHLSEELNKKFQINDPYRNITKAFIVLQSNFEILYGDILDRDFFQNAKTAVQTLPIILDISKTIRLIFCSLYKLSEPERQAEAEAIRQRRLAFCVRGYGAKKSGFITTNIPIKNQENTKLKTMNEILKINQSQITHPSTTIPTKTLSLPLKTFSADKSINQLKSKTIESSKRIQSSKSQSRTLNRKVSKTNKNQLSPSISKTKDVSPKKSSTTAQKKHNKTKSPSSKNKIQKKSKNQNQYASTTSSTSSNKYTANTTSINNYNIIDKFKNTNSNHSHTSSKEKFDWTTWLHNATLDLATILPSNQTNLADTNSFKPLLTTWASLNRISKI